jgi:hypothetical protein
MVQPLSLARWSAPRRAITLRILDPWPSCLHTWLLIPATFHVPMLMVWSVALELGFFLLLVRLSSPLRGLVLFVVLGVVSCSVGRQSVVPGGREAFVRDGPLVLRRFACCLVRATIV